jgi:TonB-linked SusC/RagA family outer membrane protein
MRIIYHKITIPPATYIFLKMMRTQIIMLLLCQTFVMAGNLKGQSMKDTRVSLDERHVSLKTIFQKIEQKTQFTIGYNAALLNTAEIVDVNVKQQPVDQVLKTLLKNYKGTVSQVGDHYLFIKIDKVETTPSENKPIVQIRVSGAVFDDTGLPLPGVTIAEKGTANATAADAEGKYNLRVADNAILVFSFIGYETQEIAVNGKTVINATLKGNAVQLNQVVVNVGYQSVRKSDLTGAISNIKSDELNSSTPTLGQALVGKAAGVEVSQVGGAPYESTKIRVRGIGSINASSDPLYVIDGYPTNANDVFINPDDVASIDILKDAASAAIYGSRASGGVILITTKRGTPGKNKMEYDFQTGIDQVSKKIKELNSTQYAQLLADSHNNAYHDLIISMGGAWNNTMYSDDNNTRTAKVGGGNAKLVDLPTDLYNFATQSIITPKYNTDWQSALYRNASFQRHNLSFSGGTDNIKYFISGGYQNQDGIVPNTGQTRINFRSNVDAQINNRLNITANISYTQNQNHETQEGRFNLSPMMAAIIIPPTFSPYDAKGNLLVGQVAVASNDYGYQIIENPLALAELKQISRKGERGSYNGIVSYKILPGLVFKANLGMQTYSEKYDYYLPTSLSSGASPPNSTASQAAATATAQSTTFTDQLAEFTLNYHKTFGKHQLDVLGGYTAQQTANDVISVSKTNFQNDDIPEITAGSADPANLKLNAATGKSEYTLLSYLARVNYNYNSRYFLTGSFRSDGSSRFGPLNRWGTFPSVAAGWNVSDESFYHSLLGDQSVVKLRASWGLSGNNGIGNYNTLQTMGNPVGVPFDSGIINNAIAPGNLKDEKLGWESTSQYNFGLDITLLKGRLSFITNYYLSYSYNLLFNQPVSSITGSTTVLTNLRDSKIRNRGFDFQLDGRLIQTKDYHLDLSGNISFNRNLVLNMGGANTIISQGGERPYDTHITEQGEPIGMFYGYKVAGIANSTNYKSLPQSTANSTPIQPGDLYFVDVNHDGVVNSADRQIIGSPYAKFTYGFALNSSYGKLTLRASFNGSYGNQILDAQDYYLYNLDGTSNNYVQAANHYVSDAQPGNGEAYRPSRVATQSEATRLSSFYLQDGSYLRCTNITLEYHLGNLLQKSLGISDSKVYIGVDNAFTLTKYRGYNPDVDYDNGANLTPGVDYGEYPLVRAYNIGVKLTF